MTVEKLDLVTGEKVDVRQKGEKLWSDSKAEKVEHVTLNWEDEKSLLHSRPKTTNGGVQVIALENARSGKFSVSEILFDMQSLGC